MMVKPARRILRAISLGVFWRRTPSTSPIMRSKKPSPGLAVTLTTSQSDSTRVPPVTALRSPPDSRITGALSPVTALSSTEAMPSMTSPSAANRIARFREKDIPLPQLGGRHLIIGGPARGVAHLLGDRLPPHAPQSRGLRFPAP